MQKIGRSGRDERVCCITVKTILEKRDKDQQLRSLPLRLTTKLDVRARVFLAMSHLGRRKSVARKTTSQHVEGTLSSSGIKN